MAKPQRIQYPVKIEDLTPNLHKFQIPTQNFKPDFIVH